MRDRSVGTPGGVRHMARSANLASLIEEFSTEYTVVAQGNIAVLLHEGSRVAAVGVFVGDGEVVDLADWFKARAVSK